MKINLCSIQKQLHNTVLCCFAEGNGKNIVCLAQYLLFTAFKVCANILQFLCKIYLFDALN